MRRIKGRGTGGERRETGAESSNGTTESEQRAGEYEGDGECGVVESEKTARWRE